MTNETLHTLETRRSCRAYKPEQITKVELEAVLRAGTFAPSAMNRQRRKDRGGAGCRDPRPSSPG